MSKEQREYENLICVCGHRSVEHNGITGNCYISGCKCYQFEQKVNLRFMDFMNGGRKNGD